MFLNMPTLPNKQKFNVNCGKIHDAMTDTGGYLYFYLKDNPGLRVKGLGSIQANLGDNSYFIFDNAPESIKVPVSQIYDQVKGYPAIIDLIKANPDEIQFLCDYHFLHYRRAGNYHAKSRQYHDAKTTIIRAFINHIT